MTKSEGSNSEHFAHENDALTARPLLRAPSGNNRQGNALDVYRALGTLNIDYN